MLKHSNSFRETKKYSTKMFFVVYFIDPQVNVVVPLEWIHNYEIQWEKFVNSGLNSNQKHRVFYSENADAYTSDHVPEPLYNGRYFATDAITFPDEGWYTGKLLKFYRKSN